MTVAITRTELDAAGLRAAAGPSKDAAAARRMLAPEPPHKRGPFSTPNRACV